VHLPLCCGNGSTRKAAPSSPSAVFLQGAHGERIRLERLTWPLGLAACGG